MSATGTPTKSRVRPQPQQTTGQTGKVHRPLLSKGTLRFTPLAARTVRHWLTHKILERTK